MHLSLHFFFCCPFSLLPAFTRFSEFLSMRYLADSVGATTAGGTYRRKPLALLNTRK
jgi:hypothetical protein